MSEQHPDVGAAPPGGRPEERLRDLWVPLPRGHRVALVLTGLSVLALAIRGVGSTLRPQGNDFTIYRDASLALLAGRSPLDVEGAIYLPFFALATLPFALLPFTLGAALWAATSLVALVGAASACARLLARPGERAWPWLVWAPTALCLRPIDSCFANGQVNLMVFGAVMAGTTALAHGRERRGASWLGLAAALKLVPAIFLAWLVARRRWRAALLGAGVALGLAVLLPMPLRGVDGSLDDLGRWAHEVAGPFARGGEDLPAAWPRTPGQSLTGALYRLAVDDPARLADRSLPPQPPSPEALERARVAVTAGSVLLLALLLVPLVRGPRGRGTTAWVRELAFVVTTALLVAPLVRKAHFVWLLLPFAVLVHAALREQATERTRRWALLALALAALLIGGTAPALVGREAATLLAVFAAPFWGLLALHAWLGTSVWCGALRRGP